MTLEQVRKYALSLPEATEQPHFAYTSFRIAGKIFATAPPEGTHVHIFVDEAQRASAIATNPDVFEMLHWGAKVVGVRAALKSADQKTINHLLLQSYKRKAPKRSRM